MKLTLNKEQLVFVVEILFSTAIEVVSYSTPGQITYAERKKMTDDPEDPNTSYVGVLDESHRHIVDHTIYNIACIFSQIVDDGVEHGEIEDLCDFTTKVKKWFLLAWNNEGKDVLDRIRRKNGKSFQCKDVFVAYPDTESLAKNLVQDFFRSRNLD